MINPKITGGLPCSKTIIDQRNALVQQLDCMCASILLAAPSGVYPSKEQEEEFITAANALAEVASKIEESVRTSSVSGETREVEV